jgi:glycerol-3-phosphate dehydrogenase (NAD(P)+)
MPSQPPTDEAIASLGAGAWGTAMAVMLARGGHRATLCVRRAAQLTAMRAARENAAYLPGIGLPENLRLTDRWSDAVAESDVVVMAVPSRHARAAVTPIASALRPGATVVSAAKGIEDGTLLTMTAMLAEVTPAGTHLAALSGPGFAAEVARGKPAAIVAASRSEAVARRVQKLFSGRSLRVYSSTDVIGVEVCAAAKNVIAIAAGTSDGLALGSSARAAVITRGLAEVMRLVEAAGGRRETAAGLSGLGDLVLTCTGDLSRNRGAGLALAAGRRPRLGADNIPLDEEGHPVAEGVANARSIYALAARLGVDMPIVAAVYRALYEGEAPDAMVDELLSRGLKAEF